MANYNNLKTAIQDVIKANGNQEITGEIMQNALLSMINSLGAWYQFVSVATPETNPGTPDQKVFYIANGKGTYVNFGGLVVDEDEVVLLVYDDAWKKLLSGIASNSKLTELESEVKDETLSVAIQQGQDVIARLAVDKKANEYVVVNFKTDANISNYTLYYVNKQSEFRYFGVPLMINKEYAYKLPEDAISLVVEVDKSLVLSSGTGEFIIYRSENEALAICDKESQEKLVESLAYTNKKTFNDIPVYNGKYLKNNGTLSDDDPLGYYSDILPVVNGDSFIYSGKVTWESTTMYVITDIYGVVLSIFNTIGTYTDKTITINEPKAAYIRFGSYEIKPTIKINYSPSMQQYVDGKIADIASKISDTNVRPKTLYNLYNPTTATKGKYIVPSTGELRDSGAHYASDFIPVESGQYYTFPIDPSFFGTIIAKNIATYDVSKAYIDSITGEISETNPCLLTIHITNENVKYIRVSAMNFDRYQYRWLQSYDTFMVVNAKSYPTRYYPYGEIPQYLDGELSSENYAMTNPLFGKTVIFDGDSICNAIEDINRYGWAGRIGTKNKMLWQNLSIGGGTFTNGGWGSHVISETDYGVANPDYIIIEGGTNDADDIGSIIDGSTPEKYGSFSLTGYTDNFTTATYCGAIESLFKRLLSNYPNAKIGVIIAQKMGVSQDYTKMGNNRRAYFETLMTLCQKWGIPYINLWDNCRLNPRLESFYNNTESSFYTDGQHLTERGYELITPIIEQWMKTL